MKHFLFCISLAFSFFTSGQINLGMKVGCTTERIPELKQSNSEMSATQVPVASFSVWANCVGQTILLTDTSLNNPTTWKWSVSGATLNNLWIQNPTMVANSPGTVTITLIVSNSAGKDTIVKTVQIFPEAKISVVPSMTYICRNEVYILTAHNNAMPTFTWNGSVVSPTISGFHNLAGIYTQSVAGIDTMGCKADTIFYVKIINCEPPYPNGIEEERIDISTDIFPNPTGGILIVNKPERSCNYEIFDLSGASVLSGEMKEGTKAILDLGDYSPGIYFLQLKVDDKIITKKIVKTN